jgi:Protein of unknown function (DUF2971)
LAENENDQQFETLPYYKYHAFPAGDEEKQGWVRDILVEHKLFFTSRKCFNDPFDCVVPTFLQTPGTSHKRYVEELLDKKMPDLPPNEWRAKRQQLMSVKALEAVREDVQKQIDKAGITCFCKVRDDILMWAHYADKHRGLCFEFDGSENCHFFGAAQPVKYEDFTYVFVGEPSHKTLERIILTKSKHWSYEREYRLFQPWTAGQKLDYPVALLTGIIFGCMMGESERQLVRQWVKEGDCCVAFFEARPKGSEFGLDIVRID